MLLTELKPGQIISRVGKPDGGQYASTYETPLAERSLPPRSGTVKEYLYRVDKPIPVLAGTTAPAFGQPGMGIQYLFGRDIQYWVKNEYLKELFSLEYSLGGT
ncbi:MAG: TNT domain-containing protein [Clostridiales Family XIII bacterium]|nr:TNT domain-containing protein [Clostridiales Family XIII bacterium]